MSKYVGLFSGGKDSMAACHKMWSEGKLNDVLFAKTGIGLPENLEFVKQTCDKFGWRLHIAEPKDGEHYEDFVRKFGFPHIGMHSAVMGYLKYHPWRLWAREHPGTILVSGRRKYESKRRQKLIRVMDEFDGKWMHFYLPLMHWTDQRVYDYLQQNDLEVSPIYKTMHMSGDCMCGAYARAAEPRLLYIFHPEMALYMKGLEEKYGGKWGNHCSISGVVKEGKMDAFLCNDCIIQQ